ncbi:NfeD family protein [Spirochaeta dissipatitropha]
MSLLPVIWWIAGILMIVSEFFVTDFVMFFFGLGAILTGLSAYFIPAVESSLVLQFLLWAGLSTLSLLGLRKYFGRVFRGKFFSPDKENDMIGASARVVEDISPDSPGRISYEGTTWKAISFTESFSAGMTVSIISKDGIGYIVTASLLEDSESEQ